jgi:hypothetical protein
MIIFILLLFSLAALNKQADSVDASTKLNAAIDQLTNFLGKTYDLNTVSTKSLYEFNKLITPIFLVCSIA